MSNVILNLLTRSWVSEVDGLVYAEEPALYHSQLPDQQQARWPPSRTLGTRRHTPPTPSTECNNKIVTMPRQEPSRAGGLVATQYARWSLASAWGSSSRRKARRHTASTASSPSSSPAPTTKVRERWWCTSCRRPREECECLCVIS